MLDVSITQHFHLDSRNMYRICFMPGALLEVGSTEHPFTQLKINQLLFNQDVSVYFIFNMP